MHRLRGFWRAYEHFRNLLYCPKNTIASVHGNCIAGGVRYAEDCDLVIAAESTRFAHRENRIGMGGMTDLYVLLHYGPKRTRELVLSGKIYSAREAYEWGLVNEVVPDDKLEEETLRWAKMVCLNAADGLMNSKMQMKTLYEALGVGTAYHARMMCHTLFSNLVWHDDEQNFLKLRTQVGAREAFRQREARYAELGFY